MLPFLQAAYAFALAHGPAVAAFLLFLVPTLITGLTPYPKAAGFVSGLRILLNLLSLLTHHDSPGTFKLPLTISSAPDEDKTVVPLSRGYARLDVLVAIAIGCLLSFAARAEDPPRAVPVLPQVAESDPPAPPIARLVGGCNKPGTVCFGPSVALTLTAWDLTHSTVVAGFNPGIGYGATFFPGRWYACGVDYFLSMQTGPQAGINQALMLKAANGYIRAGLARQVLGGQKAWFLPAGFGVDL